MTTTHTSGLCHNSIGARCGARLLIRPETSSTIEGNSMMPRLRRWTSPVAANHCDISWVHVEWGDSGCVSTPHWPQRDEDVRGVDIMAQSSLRTPRKRKPCQIASGYMIYKELQILIASSPR
jgi:hypothetical protein